jgi:HNH endonuclease
MLAFEGACPEGLQVRHLDGDPKNNKFENLVYGTPKENMEDRDKVHGRNYELNKTHCPQDHPYDDVNTYVAPDGSRQCKTCRNGGRSAPECSEPDCDNPAKALGLCGKHHMQRLRSQMTREKQEEIRAKNRESARRRRER